MFGLILAVGMLVDGAIVVVEYADKRIQEGSGPMRAYTESRKAHVLAHRVRRPRPRSAPSCRCCSGRVCPVEFMGMLPVTLIFVLSASLIVALIYLPVMGGVAGRMSPDL